LPNNYYYCNYYVCFYTRGKFTICKHVSSYTKATQIQWNIEQTADVRNGGMTESKQVEWR